MISPLPEPDRGGFLSNLGRAAGDMWSKLKRTIKTPFGQETQQPVVSPLPPSQPTVQPAKPTAVPTPTLVPNMVQHPFIEPLKKYFPENELNNAQNVIMRESSFNPQAIHVNSNGTRDIGLFQINDIHAPEIMKQFGYTMDDMLDPEKNMQVASWLFQQRGWQPWVAAQELGLAGR
jgi:hypothetical protein